MRTGLLFYDNSNFPLAAKILAAAKRYQDKFGIAPDTCFVNPADISATPALVNISVAPKQTILKNHLWLGVSNPQPAQAALPL